jgi:pimeloyl-ACP methyl ester carboxylesterase
MKRYWLSLTVVISSIALVVPAVAVAPIGRGSGAEEHMVRLSPSEALRVLEAGAGDPVVLLPGLFGSAFCFRQVVPGLVAAGARAIVIEPLGVGGSARPEAADYSLTAQADRVERVLDALGVEQAVVVAHAAAGSIALRLAYRHPRRVAAVISLDGGPTETTATPGFRRAMRFAPLLKLFGGIKRIRSTVRSTLETRSADARWVSEDVLDGYMGAASRDLDATLAGYRGMAGAREPQQLGPHLHEIACPVRLVVGGFPHEGGPTPAEVQLLSERLPFFTVEVVPGAGHFIFEESPIAFVAAVNRVRDVARPSATLAER